MQRLQFSISWLQTTEMSFTWVSKTEVTFNSVLKWSCKRCLILKHMLLQYIVIEMVSIESN